MVDLNSNGIYAVERNNPYFGFSLNI